MRLKQLLGILLLLLVPCMAAASAGSQLTNITVAGKGNATTVTLHASGAFSHTEYRPTDNLLIVDMAGVSAGKLKDATQPVHQPGVASYRVLEYKGTSGGEVARVEVELDPGSVVAVSQAAGAVKLRITAGAAAQSAKAEAAASDAKSEAKPAEPGKPAVAAQAAEAKPAARPATKTAEAPASHTRPAKVRAVSVVRARNGMDIEILANAALTGRVMKLSSPDRVVVDVDNAIPLGRSRTIAVNSNDVRDVRMGRFQNNPPVTRVVVDLAADRAYELVPSGHKLTLKLRQTAEQAAAAPPATPAEATPAVQAASQPAPEKPVFHPSGAQTVTQAAAKPAASQPAAAAQPAVTASAPPAVATAEANKPKDFVVVQASYHPAPTPSAAEDKTRAESAAQAMQTAPTDTTRLQQSVMPTPSAIMGTPAMNAAEQQPMQPAMQQPRAAAAQGAPASTAPRYTGEPISVNLKDVDIKDFFRLIHEISGLNIVLDPSVSGTVTLVLDDVPWDQALDIVLQNNGLDRRLEGNVLRIATVDTFRKEAEARRAQADANALAVDRVQLTHFLSYAKAADVMPIVKRFLSQRGDVVADPRTNALIIEDIPSVLPAVQRLLVQLDQKTAQVEIEARVVAATRSFARDIGFQLGFGTGSNSFAVGGVGNVGTSPLISNIANPKYFVTGNQIPLFSNLPAVGGPSNPLSSGISFINATRNYRVDAILTMAESRGLLKILSRPRITTQNNIAAMVQQGVRIPVVTAAQLGGPPTTQYIEAVLRLRVTPQVTAEHTIFLNVDVENTTPDFGQSVNGNPSLITQQATTSVLVNDGGTVVIGGVIQTQNSVAVNQVPLLGDIPVLGNLFKHRAVTTSSQELIFFISPKITQT